jgi:peroxiredoxin
MPELESVFTDGGGAIQFLGMNLLGVQLESEAEAERFANETGVTYPLAYDPNGLLYSHFSTVDRPAMPLTVLVDADSRVRHLQFGELDAGRLRALIEEKLTAA